MAVDHYNTLGVIPGASTADLRTAYLKLARANHPDKFNGGQRDQAQARMQQINEAWNVLGVEHKRREYDASIPARRNTQTTGASNERRGRAHFHPFDDEPVARVDIDLDSTPIAGSRAVPRWLSLMPIVCVAAGIPLMAFGTMVNAAGIIALAGISLAMGVIGFLLLPLLVMSRAERDPNL